MPRKREMIHRKKTPFPQSFSSTPRRPFAPPSFSPADRPAVIPFSEMKSRKRDFKK
jgi:hypothetical protein